MQGRENQTAFHRLLVNGQYATRKLQANDLLPVFGPLEVRGFEQFYHR
jgi:hypothetical protein